MRVVEDVKPSGKASLTEAQDLNQGITYNEAGVTYNDIRYDYGGVYGPKDFTPLISLASSPTVSVKVSRTQAVVEDQGLTYNQVGVTYNDIYLYAGVYGHQDTVPSFMQASSPVPSITGYADIYTTGVPVAGGRSLAPGFFMYLTH